MNKKLTSGRWDLDKKEAHSSCVLDSSGCVTLASVLHSFNAPINEEQAWAICYQTAKTAKEAWETIIFSGNASSQMGRRFLVIEDPSHVFLHKDGHVHEKSVVGPGDKPRRIATSESQMISKLGITLFQALDFGCGDEEERVLDHRLEVLIEKLVSQASLPDEDGGSESESKEDKDLRDEGIEGDTSDDLDLTAEKVLEMCASHLSNSEQAESHYKAVCRALVAESLELSTFLEKIAKGTKELSKSSVVVVNETFNQSSVNLDDLRISDWASLWMQVIRELRRGVKLKKVDFNDEQHKVEYELTPYEMLLDDIRLRRYKLNKIMVDGNLPPKVKKDAHAIILEFIRSRPPLVPASRRQLPPPPPQELTLYERLMISIREQHSLRPTKTIDKSTSVPVGTVTEAKSSSDLRRGPLRESTRRLIKPNLHLVLSSNFEDDDVESDEPAARSFSSLPPSQVDTGTKCNSSDTPPENNYRNYLNFTRRLSFRIRNFIGLRPSNSTDRCEVSRKPTTQRNSWSHS